MIITDRSNISPKYQVTIPKKIREKLGYIKKGEQVVFKYDDKTKRVYIEPKADAKNFIGILGKPPKDPGTLDMDRIREILSENLVRDYKNEYKGKSK